MATALNERPDFAVGDLAVDVFGLTAGGLQIDTMAASLDEPAGETGQERRLQLDVVKTSNLVQPAKSCGGCCGSCANSSGGSTILDPRCW